MDAFEPVITHAAVDSVLHVIKPADLPAWLQARTDSEQQWLNVHACKSDAVGLWVYPTHTGSFAAVLVAADLEDPMAFATLPMQLPAAVWRVEGLISETAAAALQLGWRIGAYQFTRYKAPKRLPAQLCVDAIDAEMADIARACCQVRDWVNTPTEDMGPAHLQAIAEEFAAKYAAHCKVIEGDDLLVHNFPTIHAVGRASHRAPRLIHLKWGAADAPKLSIVGKGVCFDTGGLNLKASAGMRNMKKDMGGAAHALALAGWVMARKLPVQLNLFIAAVENALGPNALRPGEVVVTRKGLSVEIDNTDAEGRLVLCDALARACDDTPDLIIDFATLTGAARVALGPDLPAMYSNDDGMAAQLQSASLAVRDPMWRMPLWQSYYRYLDSKVADLANASATPMAGSVTAALYLQKFISPDIPWVHFDVYSWNDADRPGRPAGGEAQGLRAVFAMLQARYSAS